MSGLEGGGVEVELPASVCAGDVLTVTVDGQTFNVIVPEGAASRIVVTPPLATATVIVPPGIRTGDVFLVQLALELFEVVCPPGASEGEVLDVQLPPVDSTAPLAQAPQVLQDPHPEHPPAGAAQPRRRVKVQRTNGSWSPGVIVDQDELSGTYTVQLDHSNALKHLVSDAELQDLDYEPPPVGSHYDGRRVQVRSVHRPAAWEEALVRAFDGVSRTYTVELLQSGEMKSCVRSDEIRLRTSL